MNFELNEQQRMLRSVVEKFTSERYSANSRRGYQAEGVGFSKDNWKLLADIGLLALPFAAEDGGLDGGPVEASVVMEAFGKDLVAEPFLFDILLCGLLLNRGLPADQRDVWLPSIINGDLRIALAHMEHLSRFNMDKIETKAIKRDDVFEIYGSKTFVIAALGADAYIVSALLPEKHPSSNAMGFFLVRASEPGISRHDYRLVDGSIASTLLFDAVPAVTRINCTLSDLLAAVNGARVALCAEMLGIMSMLFDKTLDYIKTRKQFSTTIGSFQAIQHRMVDLYVSLEQSRSQLYRAVLTPESDSDYDEVVSGAKSYIGERAVNLSRQCVQLHGGIGVSDELIIGHGHKRILVLSCLFGNSSGELDRYVASRGRVTRQ